MITSKGQTAARLILDRIQAVAQDYICTSLAQDASLDKSINE